MKAAPSVFELLERVRQRSPVVHHVTNWVTINDCAQTAKALGASPIMAHAKEEVADIAQIASALVINIGTLTPETVESMRQAARAANERVIPVVLDVCGAGASRLRDQKLQELLTSAMIDVIKGNVSEIARLSGQTVRSRGVDAGDIPGEPIAIAQRVAKGRDATVVVTGAVDIITDAHKTFLVRNGHSLMAHVVGTGCMAASAIGAFAAVEPDLNLAAAAALVCFGVAGELAAEKASGPASFKTALLDCLYNLDRETIERRHMLTG